MNKRKTMRSVAGFTLLEVLVAFVVLSVGLLSLGGLQMFSISNVRDAYFRTQALMLSYDIADRMRANLGGVDDGTYDKIGGSQVDQCRSAAGCTTANLSNDDVFEWRTVVSNALPAGDAIVCIDSTPNDGTSFASASCDGSGNQYVVKVWWDNDRDTTTENYRLTTIFVP